jgi:APA family basic amino acid/polyamine antiporter
MAMTFASYAVAGPVWLQRLATVAAVVGLAALNYRGVRKTAVLSRVLVSATLLALVVIVIGIAVGASSNGGETDDFGFAYLGSQALGAGGVYGVLQSAGLLFFAFAGYARIATLGEEIRDPARAIPRAIPIALGLTVMIYALVGGAALLVAGPERLAAAAAPLAEAVRAAGVGSIVPVVGVGAALASLGALLALIAGIGRTCLAMARNRDLPSWLAVVHPRHQVPHHAELALAVVVSSLVLTADLGEVIGFLIRRARLLRDRQHGGVRPNQPSASIAALAERARGDRLRGPRRDPATRLGGGPARSWARAARPASVAR